jgi:hypothetical protein
MYLLHIFLLYTNLCRGCIKQSQGENPLENDNTHTIKVSTTIGTTEEYITPSGIVAMVSSGDDSHLSPLSGFTAAHYTLVRLSKVGDANVLKLLDGKIWRVNQVPSIKQLHDRSWEMVVLKSLCGTLQETLDNIFPGSDVDMNYNPLKPTANDVEVCGPDQAKKLYELCFVQRAKTMVREAWPVAAAYYAYRLETMDGPAARSHCLDDLDQRILSSTNPDETPLCSSHITLCSGGEKVDALKPSDQQSAIMRYGCTFSGCFRDFDGEQDWKRHEQDSHFQEECWKCNLCPQLRQTKVKFATHLEDAHILSTKKIQQLQQKQRIGRDNLSRFWCGFCEEILALQHRGLEAKEERFSHIRTHFINDEVIADWIEMDGRGAKGHDWDVTPLLSRPLHSPC